MPPKKNNLKKLGQKGQRAKRKYGIMAGVAGGVAVATKAAERYFASRTQTKTKKKSQTQSRKDSQGGQYAGQIKPRRRKVDNTWNLYGAVHRLETSGVIDSSQAQYLGHSTVAPRTILDNMCRCMVKELCRQSGRPIQNWNEIWRVPPAGDNAWSIKYRYFTRDVALALSSDEDPTELDRSVAILENDTFDNIAKKLATDIHNAFTSHLQHEFISFELERSTFGVSLSEITAKVFCQQFYITIGNNSYLKFQNTTAARSVEQTEDEPDDSAENIRANPLNYRCYQTNYRSGFIYTFRRNIAGATTKFNFVPDDTTAVITYDPTDHNFEQLYKAPNASALGCKGTQKGKESAMMKDGVLQPGDIKTSYLSYQKRFSWNYLMKLLIDTLGNTLNYIVDFGNARVICFEHLLKVSGDPNVQLSYQLDLISKMKYSYRPKIMTEQIIIQV